MYQCERCSQIFKQKKGLAYHLDNNVCDFEKNMKKKLIELCKCLKVEEKVLFLGYQTNPFKFFKKADVYVLSSVFEGFPNALVEAMAVGLPVIATDCSSGPREILAPELNFKEEIKHFYMGNFGLLTPDMSKEINYDANKIDSEEIELSKAIIKILEDSELANHYAKMSLERINDFSFDKWNSEQINIINKVYAGGNIEV